jgi:cell division protein FtsN
MPLFIALFGTLLVGLFLGFIAGLISGTKTKREALRTKKDVGENSTRPELNKPQEDK